jgi:hypothetical protein
MINRTTEGKECGGELDAREIRLKRFVGSECAFQSLFWNTDENA